jgi:hypothetical protein
MRIAPVLRRQVGVALFGLLAAAVVGLSWANAQVPATPARSAKPYVAPRTPWGDPDFDGVWTSDANYAVPFERPVELGTREFLDGKDLEDALARRGRQVSQLADGGPGVGAGPTHWYENLTPHSRRSSLVIDPPNGRLPPLTAEAKVRAAAAQQARRGRGQADSWTDRNLWDRCITVGLPSVMFPTGYNNNVQIIQAPGYVTITHEMIHDSRVIPLDGRPHISAAIRHYMGDARGRWEGNTLVIDVTNFRPETEYRGSSDTLHLIERYTRVAPDQMRYEVTVDDPHTYERAWTAVLDLSSQKDMFEYACHEGNFGLRNILSAARAEEAAAAKK